jgi:ferrous iron transport protein A
MHKTLDTLALNTPATLVQFGNTDVALKFQELGLIAGTELMIKHIAPLGCPIIIAFDGMQVTLRKADARLLFITQ